MKKKIEITIKCTALKCRKRKVGSSFFCKKHLNEISEVDLCELPWCDSPLKFSSGFILCPEHHKLLQRYPKLVGSYLIKIKKDPRLRELIKYHYKPGYTYPGQKENSITLAPPTNKNKNAPPQYKYAKEFHNLKPELRELYNHTCQLCGKTERELPRLLYLHHIDYNKENNVKENLIPLCMKCNVKVNADRFHWQDHFSKIVHAKLNQSEILF